MTALRALFVLAAASSIGGCFAIFGLDGYGPPGEASPDAAPPWDTPDAGPIDAGEDSGDAGAPVSAVNYAGKLGADGGARHEDTCPAGQVMIGAQGGAVADGFYETVLSRFRVICGTLTAPEGDAITIGPGALVPDASTAARGNVAVAATQVICPANQVVVGFKGRTVVKDFPPPLAVVSRFDVSCASISKEEGKVVISAAAAVEGIGSRAGTAVGPFDCQPDTVAVGMRVQAGDIVDTLEMRCDLPIAP